MRLKYEKVIHHAIVNNLFGFGYTKKSCNAQGSSKYYLFVTAPSNGLFKLQTDSTGYKQKSLILRHFQKTLEPINHYKKEK